MPGSSLDKPKIAVKPFGTGRPLKVEVVSCKSLRRYATTPQAVKVCPGKPLLAVAGRYLQLWSLQTEQIVHKLWSGEQQLVAVDFSSDGKTLFAGEVEGKVRQYEVDTGAKKETLGSRSWGLFPDRVRDVACLFGKPRVAVCSDTTNIRIFDPSNQKVVRTLDWHQTGFFTRLARKTLSLSSSKTGLLAAGGADGSVTVYDCNDFEEKCHTVVGKGDVLALEFSSDGEFLAVADSRGTVSLLKSPTYKVVQELKHTASPRTLSFSHDLRIIATGASDCQIRLFHLTTGNELLKLSHHTGGVLDLDFCDFDSKLISIGNDRRLYVTQLKW
jgi:WD40 repeat protein